MTALLSYSLLPPVMLYVHKIGNTSYAGRVTVDNLTVRLHACEEELSAIYENVPGIVFYIAVEPNGDFRFLSVSREFLVATGLTRQQVAGSLVRDIIPTPSRDMVLDHYREAIRSGRPVRWEEESVYPAGRRYGEVAVTPLYDANGIATRLIGIVHDITDRKRLDQERAEEERRKDEFLSLLGHELRNPLAVISTAVQLLSRGVTEERRVSLNGMMERQLNVMHRVLDDLIDLSRITHGYIQLKKESIDLSEFLQHITEVSRSTVAERGQELILRCPSEVIAFRADEARLEQVAINLLNNASKYTAQGGTIEFSGAREGAEIVLRCKDNGRGIPLEMQEKIFQPFTRVGPITDSHGEASLGIGLALVKQLVELHGGTISVESGGPGAGSEFLVSLPLESTESEQLSDSGTKPAPASPSSRSIVLVEDNSDLAETMLAALEQAGYRATLFRDATAALAVVPELEPHAILLDIGVPGMNGYELAANLRGKQHLERTLFIAISGFKRNQTPGALDAFDHYLTKPIDLSYLLNLLGSTTDPQVEHAIGATAPVIAKTAMRALLIDDHAALAAAMTELLKGEGLEVRTARSGEEGLQSASSFRPQLILCDLNLPDLSGQETIRRLHANPATRHAYSVILTALSEAEIRGFNDEANTFGVDEYIRKPLKSDVLRSLVAKVRAVPTLDNG